MTSSRAQLAEIVLPDFGMPASEPLLPPSIFADRLERLRFVMERSGYDHIVVWADREHSANIAYLTGFDPRFEEAVLIVGATNDPALLLGNECFDLGSAAPLPVRPVRFQDLSLPGQARDNSRPLAETLRDESIGPGSRVGVVGWKTYANRSTIEAPAFLVDELRLAVGPAGLVENATDILINAADGLRVINEVEQLATFEWAACQTSRSVRRVLTGMQPGMTERDAARMLEWNGAPLSCHLMLSAGPRARYGLLSPGDRPIERGDPFTIAYGVWGALNCRAGFVVEEAEELPEGVIDYVARLVAPYFEAVADWYGNLHV
ncbi:MAG TPA: aminopeptidase P family N-terminal domain-containing protein, partial [Ilumatobacteraceae bacterium]|nr:aminopeptidase P family N-terminal domain-containing protein [Ilumatobacteraceae bacterium]